MFGFLRLIRGFCGLVFAMQVVYLLEVVVWLTKPEADGADIGKLLALSLIKVIAMALSGWLFFWLRNLINRLHTKKHGVPHPALADKKWAL